MNRYTMASALAALTVLATGALTGCGSGSDTTTAADPGPATVTVTASATETPTPTAPDATEGSKEVTTAEESFTMPNVVGEVLQTAQDRLQSLGSYVMDQQDAGGLDRVQVVDANWKVCSQKPKPGAKVAPSDTVTLAAVKLEEDCP
jgi:hypothetical protein